MNSYYSNKKQCAYEGCEEDILETSKEGYCIFHERDDNKDKEEFQRNLDLKLKNEDYDFENYFFVGLINFSNFTFPEEANFASTHFSGGVDFRNAKFYKKAFFARAKFLGEENVIFERVEFFGESVFTNAKFEGDVIFSNATFSAGTTFLNSKFSGKADFSEAKFSREADFRGIICIEHTYFSRSTFLQEANFEFSKFLGPADFVQVKFDKAAKFRNSEFSDIAFFNYTRVRSKANFEGARFLRAIYFQQIELGTVQLANTNIESVNLTNVEWASNYKNTYEKSAEKRKIHKHVKKFDRLEIMQIYKIAEQVYRKVKTSYHRTGNYDLAGEFYYREMECKRKQIRFQDTNILGKLFRRVGYNFLRFFCGYGEKPWRVIGFSLLLTLVLAGVFMFAGINDSDGNPLVKYQLSFKSSNWSWKLVTDYMTCFYYSVITFTTLGYGDVRPCVGAARYISMFEAFFGAFSLAVFVLTFGRKMMR